ncbi:hypothetical protein [Paraburkholderia sp. MM5482-R1]
MDAIFAGSVGKLHKDQLLDLASFTAMARRPRRKKAETISVTAVINI